MASLPSGRVMVSAAESTALAGSNSCAACTALPSAVVVASVLFSDLTVTRPVVTAPSVPAVMTRPSAISAMAVEVTTVTPTAPAT